MTEALLKCARTRLQMFHNLEDDRDKAEKKRALERDEEQLLETAYEKAAQHYIEGHAKLVAKHTQDDPALGYYTFYANLGVIVDPEALEAQWSATPQLKRLEPSDAHYLDWVPYTHGVVAGISAKHKDGEALNLIEYIHARKLLGFETEAPYWVGMFEGSGGRIDPGQSKRLNKNREYVDRFEPVVYIKLADLMYERLQRFAPSINWPTKQSQIGEYRLGNADAREFASIFYGEARLTFAAQYENAKTVMEWLPAEERKLWVKKKTLSYDDDQFIKSLSMEGLKLYIERLELKK